jgi:hypothetical protein
MPKAKRKKVESTNVPKPPRPKQRMSLEPRIVLERLAEPWDQPSVTVGTLLSGRGRTPSMRRKKRRV